MSDLGDRAHVLVCSACGSLACWDGDLMCEGYRYAGTVDCPCAWGAGRGTPVVADPECPAHGVAS